MDQLDSIPEQSETKETEQILNKKQRRYSLQPNTDPIKLKPRPNSMFLVPDHSLPFVLYPLNGPCPPMALGPVPMSVGPVGPVPMKPFQNQVLNPNDYQEQETIVDPNVVHKNNAIDPFEITPKRDIRFKRKWTCHKKSWKWAFILLLLVLIVVVVVMVLYFIVWKPSSSLQVVTYAGGGTNATINGSLMNAQFGDIEGIVFHNDFMYISEKSSTIRVISKSLGIVNTLISDTVGQYDSLGFVNGSGMVWMNESLFVCDAGNHAVRRIINGNVTTVVGGRVGYVDGPLSDALLDTPVGIAVDDRMNLYVTEQHRIRMISNDGIVSTIAGSIPGFQDGTGTEAMFSYPTGIVWSNGVLYVADRYNSRIRKVVGNQVTTLAGGLNGPFSQPMYLAIDGDLLYVTDSLLHQIKTVKINDGQVQVVAGNGERGKRNGKLQESQFNLPLGIAVDRDSVYVVDRDNFVIRRISK